MNNDKTIKKEAVALVYKKIGDALAELKGHVKEKKFDKILQKVSNMLAAEIAEAAAKASMRLKKKQKAIKKAEKKLSRSKGRKNNKLVAAQTNGVPAPAESASFGNINAS